jgi:excisionase family DNA binding protein
MATRLVTPRNAETQIGFAPATVYRWVADGRLPFVRIGRSIRLRQSDLDRMIRGGSALVRPEARGPGRASARRADDAVTQ